MNRIWQRLSKREKGLVALTLFIFLLVLGRFLLVSPFLARREWVKSQLEIQPQLLEKNFRYVGQKAEMTANLEKTRGEIKTMESSLLAGDTPSVSASELQQTVQGVAAREGTQVISTRVLNPEAMGSFTKIPIQIEVSGQIDQVANLIKGIESTEKLLVISELNIRSLFTPVLVARPQTVPQTPPQNLRASITITGFSRAQPTFSSKNASPPARTKSEEEKNPAKPTPRR